MFLNSCRWGLSSLLINNNAQGLFSITAITFMVLLHIHTLVASPLISYAQTVGHYRTDE